MQGTGNGESVPPPRVELGIEGLEEASEIGRGGFGVVYRARQPALNRLVAVKMLTGSALTAADHERFAREGRALGTLSGHPNIVNVLAVGVSPAGAPYIVMSYLGRGSMAERVRREGPLPWREVVRVGVKLAGALETAHRADALHRDVKPENVLISDYGDPLLADFGIARLAGGYETTSGQITASIAHAAPELLDGRPPSVATDVYSLGSTLFTLAAGEPAFPRREGEELVAQYLRIASQPVPDLRVPGVPEALCRILEQSLAKDPAQRQPSAAELGRRLQQIEREAGLPVTEIALLAGQTVTLGAGSQVPYPAAEPTPSPAEASRTLPPATPPDSPPDSLPDSPPRRRRVLLMAGVVVAVLAVVGAVAGAGLLRGRGEDAGPAGLFEPQGVAVDAGGFVYVADSGNNRVVRVTPDGSIEVVAGSGTDGHEGDGGPATEAALSYPTDMAVDGDGVIYISDAGNGVVRRIAPDGIIDTIALESGGDVSLYADALELGPEGELFLALDTRVVRITADRELETVAGTGTAGFSGEGGDAVEARIDDPHGLAFDAVGNLYFADSNNNRVRMVEPDGTITTVAGNGSSRASGDRGPATDAGINAPSGVAVGIDGALYVIEYGDNRVRRVDADGIITTVAGDPAEYTEGFSGDGGPATSALFRSLRSVAVDADGALYLVDEGNNRIRRIDPDGTVTTVA